MSAMEYIQPPVVGLEVQGPSPQRRWTVAIRIIIAVPTLFYAGLLGFVAFFATVGIWFAALFTGRAPEGLAEFVGKVVQYTTRVHGYAFLLLTDKYPPWDLDADHALAVVLPPRGRLNRAAVFFRLILMVPIWFVLQFVQLGLFPVMFFVWLIVLVAGRLPQSVWEALSVMLRYETRAYGYATMLTPEYPRGLFGDKDKPPLGYVPPPLLQQEPVVAGPVSAPVLPADPTAFRPDAAPRVSRFLLSKAAKRIVVLVVVLGVILQIGGSIASASFGNLATAAELEEAYDRLSGSVDDAAVASQTCAIDAGGFDCLHRVAADLAIEVERFRSELRDLDIPSAQIPLADRVDGNAEEMANFLRTMSTTSDPAEYDDAARGFQQAAEAFDANAANLYDQLVF